MLFLLNELKKWIFFTHKLLLIDNFDLKINQTKPTSTTNDQPTFGLQISFQLEIQNIGKKKATISKISYFIEQQDSLLGGLFSCLQNNSVIFPGHLSQIQIKKVINVTQNEVSHTFDIHFFIETNKGPIVFFVVNIFNNPSHPQTHSISIKRQTIYNRIQSSLLRVRGKQSRNQLIDKVLTKIIGITEKDLMVYVKY